MMCRGLVVCREPRSESKNRATFPNTVIGDAATSVTFRAFLAKRLARCAAGSGCANLRHAMPRGPRLDAPGTLHHIMVRGIERTNLFRDDTDRADFLAHLAGLVERGAVPV